jgi:hypothetical protein
MVRRRRIDSNGVVRGPRGGVSSYNTNWRGYYANYDSFVAAKRAERAEQLRKHQEEQAKIPLKPLAKEDSILKKHYGFYFDHDLIAKMDDKKFQSFLNSLSNEERDIYYREQDAIQRIEDEMSIQFGEDWDAEPPYEPEFDDYY